MKISGSGFFWMKILNYKINFFTCYRSIKFSIFFLESLLVIYIFQRICQFYQSYWICWHRISEYSLSCNSNDVHSFTPVFSNLCPFFFFMVSVKICTLSWPFQRTFSLISLLFSFSLTSILIFNISSLLLPFGFSLLFC